MESTDLLGTISKLIKRADRASRLSAGVTFASKRRAFVQSELDQPSIASNASSFSVLRLGHEGSGMVSVHWKEHGEFLLRSIADFLDQGRLVDGAVTYGPQSLRVHRLVLAAFLPAFRESQDDDDDDDDEKQEKKKQLSFDDMADDFDDVTAVIQFIYTGTLTVSESRLERLRRLAKKLHFRGLADALARDVVDEPTVDHQQQADDVSTGMVVKVEPELVPYFETAPNYCGGGSSDVDDVINPTVHKDKDKVKQLPAATDVDNDKPVVARRRRSARKRRRSCRLINYAEDDSEEDSVPIDTDVADSVGKSVDDGNDENRSAIYVCSLCKKRFTEALLLSYHVTDFHKQWKPFRCQLCRKVFADPQKLRGHFKLAHKDFLPYRCSHCPRQFAIASELMCHVRDSCTPSASVGHGGSSTRDDRSDRSHRSDTVACGFDDSHVDAKYACVLCEQQFHDELTIRRHMDAVHGHWKPFACGSCSLTFVHAGQLRMHLSGVHDVPQLLRCHHCPKTFMRQARLGRHIERVHRIHVPRTKRPDLLVPCT